MKRKENEKSKPLSLTQILEQNPVSCGNCFNFKIKKGTHKLYARCTLRLTGVNKKHWSIERKFSCIPLGWKEAERCKHFIIDEDYNSGSCEILLKQPIIRAIPSIFIER